MDEAEPRIFVVDDDPAVCESLEALIRSAGFKSETFSSARDFLARPPHDGPACLVLDVRMPGLSGLDLQKELADRNNDIPIVFITGHGDIPMSVQAMKTGAVDFLPKSFDDDDLLGAVSEAIDRHRRARRDRAENDEIRRRIKSLTPRERQVFELVITGMLNKQIAFDLGISEQTVKIHRGRVMRKMQVVSVAELVRLAEQLGIRPSESSAV